ncbi:SusC/RagA family TonB-linked outer membrane protein [Aquimarina agarilytica]|uniref:SusC/RagA family TonB-linked outer membrane protein n=1 Tax=Aquimarina agarilytica TaxID=1087449 RepID=UPI000289B4EE|nr:TonB-dependent receptor [Aquimarina agarilytica]
MHNKKNILLCANSKKIFLALALLMGVFHQQLYAEATFFKHFSNFQQTEFTGTVTDESGIALPGVTVTKKGSDKGAVTDFDGFFSIPAKEGDIITFSYIGYKNYTVVYTGQKKLKVKMEEDIESLDEVVVIGYGKVTKKEVTGAISQVKGEELEKIVTPSVEQALQGKVAGVNITAAGRPGDDAIIEIRGISSLTGNSTPLYVVDGVVQPNIPRLNSSEIESVEVLKDAASAAIYGVQGGNGVILISTKKPKIGKAKLDFNYATGLQRIITERTPLLNSRDQLYARNLAIRNGAPSFFLNTAEALRNDDFDIRDLILVDYAEQNTYNLGISGGSPTISYNLTGGYHEQDGVVVNTKFKRHNVRATTSYKKGRLWARASVAYTQENRNDPRWNILPQSIIYAPYNESVDLDADLVNVNEGSNFLTQNFVASIREKNRLRRDIVNLSVNTSYDLVDHLKFKSWMGYYKNNEIRNRFVPQFATFNPATNEIDNDPLNSFVEARSRLQDSYTLDNTLEWDNRYGKHHIKVLAGFSLQKSSSSFFVASRQGVTNNNIQVINGGTLNESAASGEGFLEDRVIERVGTIGRIQYDYKKKYLISMVIRRDASSIFGRENRWGVFPSTSIAWNVSDEAFWSPLKSVVNKFKLRASLAEVGSDKVNDPYLSDLTISNSQGAVFGGARVSGFVANTYNNPDLKWETTVQRNFGVDLSFLKNKITLTGEYYKDEKTDLLLPVRLPASAGSDILDLTANVGSLVNEGFEVELNYKDQIGDFKFNLGATYTQNENIVEDLFNTDRIPHAQTLISGDPSSTVSQFRVGMPASAFYLYETDGVINTDEELAEYTSSVSTILGLNRIQKGDLKIIDQNEDGVINDEDRVFKGSGLPDYTVGINLGCDYKGFDFSMNWYASVGNEILNGPKALAYNRNRHRDLVYQWSEANPNSNIPAYRGDGKSHFNYAGSTDLWIEDGSFVRLKQIGLGYTLDNEVIEKLGLKRLRMSLSAQNVLTFTDYKGFDPEITNPLGSNDIRNRGVDIGNYPIAAQYLFGLQIDF